VLTYPAPSFRAASTRLEREASASAEPADWQSLTKIFVIAISFTREQNMQAMVKIVIPLCIEAINQLWVAEPLRFIAAFSAIKCTCRVAPDLPALPARSPSVCGHRSDREWHAQHRHGAHRSEFFKQ